MANTTSTIMPSSTEAQDDVDLQIGFITAQLSSLPIGIRAILTLLCLLLGVALCTVSPYAARWGTQWGVGDNTRTSDGMDAEHDTKKKKRFRLEGGVLGIFTGGLGAAYIILLLSLAVLETQDDPSLSPWAMLAISVIAGIAGGILGGRWRAVSRLLLNLIGSISVTLLFTTSFKIDNKLGRLIIFLILFVLFLVTSFIFSLLPRSTLVLLSNRIAYFLCACTGAWLIYAVGLDIFVKSGLLDGVGLMVSQRGIFGSGPLGDEDVDGDRSNVIRWNEGRCKGLIAAMWLTIVAGTAFQLWRYSVIGDDPDESWNTYLGSLLSNEKALMSQTRNNTSSGMLSARAGFFTARQGWFKRLFMSSSRQKKRLMPATYMIPEEQGDSHTAPYHNTPALTASPSAVSRHGDYQSDMGQAAIAGVEGRRNAPPAKYDSLGYSTVGLGLYDGGSDPRDAYYTNDHGAALYDYGQLSSHAQTPVPMYSPGIYATQAQAQAQMQRSESEPSFNAVPQYSPHSTSRVEHPSTLSGETMVDHASDRHSGEGIYSMGSIVEEPEEEDNAREREAFIAPLSPRARERDFNAEAGRSSSYTQRPAEQARSGTERAESVPIAATPSLVSAIRRVSEAQAQARAYRVREQQAALSPSFRSESDIASSPHPFASPTIPTSASSSPRIPESERIALRQAAIRRQASAEWWNEVERRANEQAHKERSSSSGNVSPNPGAAVSFSPRVSSAPDETSLPWRSGSKGPARCK